MPFPTPPFAGGVFIWVERVALNAFERLGASRSTYRLAFKSATNRSTASAGVAHEHMRR